MTHRRRRKLHGLQCPLLASFRSKFPRLLPDATQTWFRLLLFSFPLLRASATEGKPRGQSSAPRKFRRADRHNLPCRKRTNYTKTPRLRSSAAFSLSVLRFESHNSNVGNSGGVKSDGRCRFPRACGILSSRRCKSSCTVLHTRW